MELMPLLTHYLGLYPPSESCDHKKQAQRADFSFWMMLLYYVLLLLFTQNLFCLVRIWIFCLSVVSVCCTTTHHHTLHSKWGLANFTLILMSLFLSFKNALSSAIHTFWLSLPEGYDVENMLWCCWAAHHETVSVLSSHISCSRCLCLVAFLCLVLYL